MRFSPYIVGAAVLGAPCCAECGRRQVVGRGGVVGADKVYTDKSTVKQVQRQLHALAVATGNDDFDPYSDGYKDDGVLGSRTQLAITAFNRAYGWPDDNWNITDGTLTALKRPDVVNPAAANKPQNVAVPTTIAPPPPPAAFGSPSPPAPPSRSKSLPIPDSVWQSKEQVAWGPIVLGSAAVLGVGAIGWAMLTRGGPRK